MILGFAPIYPEIIQPGKKLISNIVEPRDFGIPLVEAVLFLRPGEVLSEEEVIIRAQEMGANLGQYHAERLLKECGYLRMEGWGEGILLLPGTLWRDSEDGKLYVPGLGWKRQLLESGSQVGGGHLQMAQSSPFRASPPIAHSSAFLELRFLEGLFFD